MDRQNACSVVTRLQEAGHEAFFAGGCVRDRILGLEPSDYDVATSALPDQVEALFERTRAVGKRFGIVLVPMADDWVEVATFREDGPYHDGRRPESVRFSNAERDAQRRDFTINALFEDPNTGEIQDHVGGKADIDNKVLRAVGDPHSRFEEDQLRLLRAVRFAARFNFAIEPNTMTAMRDCAGKLGTVSAERIGEETARLLTDGNAGGAFRLLDQTNLLGQLLPEMSEMKGCLQSPDHHPEGDVFIHTLRCLDQLEENCSETLALGVLLHDIAKPRTAVVREGRHTFYGHERVGAELGVQICRRWRRSNETCAQVEFLVQQHLRHSALPEMRTATRKRFLRQDGIEELLALTQADALGAAGDLSASVLFAEALAALAPDEARPIPLLTGSDMIARGMSEGPELGRLLKALEEAQLEGEITDRDSALALAYRLAPDLTPIT
jgi:poly(A) polymerase